MELYRNFHLKCVLYTLRAKNKHNMVDCVSYIIHRSEGERFFAVRIPLLSMLILLN